MSDTTRSTTTLTQLKNSIEQAMAIERLRVLRLLHRVPVRSFETRQTLEELEREILSGRG